jgi:hypothetical protein
MNELPIADCRLPINGSFGGRRFARGRHDGCQGVGFLQQDRQFFCRHQAGLNQQLKPQGRFIGFFFNRAYFGDELRPAPCPARCAIIRGYRSSTTNNLFGNHTAGIVIFGNGTGQFDDSQRKSFGPSFEFDWVHDVKLQIQSAIGNRQSAITR